MERAPMMHDFLHTVYLNTIDSLIRSDSFTMIKMKLKQLQRNNETLMTDGTRVVFCSQLN